MRSAGKTEPARMQSAIVATHDKLLAKVRVAVMDAPVCPAVGGRGTSSMEDTHIRDLGFSRRTNFFVGAAVLAVLGTAALLILRIIFWIR